ncbi:MAG TPA: hypothetical protein VFW23_11575 [Tepidisphaeraceae bacterium]|nr:hypothetical protein [Tepidisphaeraceae bacterium]
MNPHSPRPQRKPYVRQVIRRTTGTDFNLFNAIVGADSIMEPTVAERAAIEVLAAVPPPPPPTLKSKIRKELANLPSPTRSAASLASQVREICERRITLHVSRPQMAEWLRHVSTQAIRRLEEAHARLNSRRIQPERPQEQRRVA